MFQIVLKLVIGQALGWAFNKIKPKVEEKVDAEMAAHPFDPPPEHPILPADPYRPDTATSTLG